MNDYFQFIAVLPRHHFHPQHVPCDVMDGYVSQLHPSLLKVVKAANVGRAQVHYVVIGICPHHLTFRMVRRTIIL